MFDAAAAIYCSECTTEVPWQVFEALGRFRRLRCMSMGCVRVLSQCKFPSNFVNAEFYSSAEIPCYEVERVSCSIDRDA